MTRVCVARSTGINENRTTNARLLPGRFRSVHLSLVGQHRSALVRVGLRPGVWRGFLLYRWLAKRGFVDLPPAKVGDFILGTAIFGVMLGGRLGYVLFYKPEMLREPLSILRVWEGGMSSHGGMLGILVFALYYARRHKLSWTNLGDNLVVAAPIGLLFGRCANFINGELYGRATNVAWAMQFPKELFDNVDASGSRHRRLFPNRSVPDHARRDRCGRASTTAGERDSADDFDAAASVAALRSVFRRNRFVRDLVVRPHAHAAAERRFDRTLLYLLRDLPNRRRKLSRTGRDIDRRIYARPILLLLPDPDRTRICGRGKDATVFPKKSARRS